MKLGDSAVTNVIQPQGNITTVLGTAGLSAGGANYDGSQFLGIDINGSYNSSNGKVTGTVGISPDGVVNTTGLPAGTTGQYAIVQTKTEGASRSDYFNGSLMPASTVYEDDTLPDRSMPSSPLLDTIFPYTGKQTLGSGVGTTGADSPKTTLSQQNGINGYPPNFLSVSESFTDTLMFDPGGICMPVGSMTWGRSRRAGYVSGSGWSCTNAQQSSTKYTLNQNPRETRSLRSALFFGSFERSG